MFTCCGILVELTWVKGYDRPTKSKERKTLKAKTTIKAVSYSNKFQFCFVCMPQRSIQKMKLASKCILENIHIPPTLVSLITCIFACLPSLWKFQFGSYFSFNRTRKVKQIMYHVRSLLVFSVVCRLSTPSWSSSGITWDWHMRGLVTATGPLKS